MDREPNSWEVDIPLLTNPNMLGAWLKAMGATYLLCMLIMGAVMVGTGEWEQLPMLAGIFALVVGGILVLGLLIMLLVFGNRFRARFTVSDKGIAYEGIDKRARSLARMAVVAGALGGSARTAGAGLLAVSGENVDLQWQGIASARYQPRRHTIVLRNAWRDLMHVYCTPENYAAVRSLVEQQVPDQGAAVQPSAGRSPLPWALLHTGLVVGACMPLFALNDITRLDIFVPLLIMLFALAIVWLIPLFGWVVLPLAAYLLIDQLLALTGLREYTLVNTYSYRKYEALDGGEWAIVMLALAGLVYLAWISWQAVRGRFVPVLMRDRLGTDS
ncbi:MAG: hypothetical protein V2J89_04390 [Halieaceae bacterium]|jgi:hypothetical protein|nr:hypothetical protein [Halieaceae bacterium]